MRQYLITPMNEVVTASASAPLFTSPGLSDMLASTDTVSVMATAFDFNAIGGSFNLVIDQSSDGENWVRDGAGISMTITSTDPLSVEIDLTDPMLAYIRFGASFTYPTTSGRVRIQAVGRDVYPSHPLIMAPPDETMGNTFSKT